MPYKLIRLLGESGTFLDLQEIICRTAVSIQLQDTSILARRQGGNFIVFLERDRIFFCYAMLFAVDASLHCKS